MVQHISVRVPWKDNGYKGFVCDKPCFNNSCLKLKNVIEKRNDELENTLHGAPILGHESEIPCLVEGACFMSDHKHTLIYEHPYKKSNPITHGHFLETEINYEPFSFPVRPYGWLMLQKSEEGEKANINKLIKRYGVSFDFDKEPILPFNSVWVQDADNQREIFKKFYQDVIPNKSLVFAYSKQVPFIEDAKRIVMGVGFITSLVEPPEHNHTDEGELRSLLWETMARHSIRDTRENGFLLPYYEMMEYAENNPEFDLSSIAVTVDDEYFNEFSFASEHLSYDAVISVLNKTIKALEIIKKCIPGNWNECIKWTKDRLREVWLDRGPYPGLGAMLTAYGFNSGHLMAREIKNNIGNNANYEDEIIKAFPNIHDYFSDEISDKVGQIEAEAFLKMSDEDKTLFWLLARMSLTDEQADFIFNLKDNPSKPISCSTKEIIENPYVLYEKTRLLKDTLQISVNVIDMAVFPADIVSAISPVPEPSKLTSDNDKRRIRALSVYILEKQSLLGNTAYPQVNLIEEINSLPIEKSCNVNGNIINSIVDFMEEEIIRIPCSNEENAFQLSRMNEIDEVIRSSVNRRINAPKHDINENWSEIYDNEFPNPENNARKNQGKKERIAILDELAKARLSVLIGGAGTGKTTLLAILCKSKQISNGGILLLAPTGKARVRISQTMDKYKIQYTAMTVAQFLMKNKRYDWKTMRYRIADAETSAVPNTVIVDESSMLTEEMFGALLQAAKKAHRIIFLGDPNQLPPIGAGRPFVDLVKYLEPEQQDCIASNCYGKLTLPMRQISEEGEEREDMRLSQWYSDNTEELDDTIFTNLQNGDVSKYLKFKQWETPEELENIIFETIQEEVGMNNIDDILGFDLSLGGYISGKWMNFGQEPEKIDSWQILSAYRSDASIGTATINRYVHEKYRSQEPTDLKVCIRRGTKHLLGTDGVVYGDKVINVRNQKKGKSDEYFVANGEVGIVHFIEKAPNMHKIKFSSQPDKSYSWYSRVGEEANNDIELAYALTVHKSQGSEFGKVIMVLSEPSRMLSKELLYTALTRQKDKLIILYNGPAYKLRDYSLNMFSEVARRCTCLFKVPELTEYKGKYYEKALIHKTERGELVRSKSEVIIANMLHSKGIDYEYEKELDLGEDGIRIPDFTIDDQETGIKFIWEHCGMLNDATYKKRWEEKKRIYEKHGIKDGYNLIVSKDEYNGSIDSEEIMNLIKKYLL